MLGLPGGVEWIIILVIALLLFGKRLPNVMRSLGQGVKEFKRGVNSVEDEVSGLDETEPDTSSGELPEGEYEGDYEYEDEYTEEGYREPQAEEYAETADTDEQMAEPEADQEPAEGADEADDVDEAEDTSKPTG